MFTGIIKTKGVISRISRENQTARITIKTLMTKEIGSAIGDSINVNGICLTITKMLDDGFVVEVMPETTRRTSLNRMEVGMQVNLEPALLATARLDGHFVLGHVDTTAELTNRVVDQNSIILTFKPVPSYLPYIIEKGSVALDGVSLTVSDVSSQDFSVSLIPHTLAITTLGDLSVGHQVNVETDILGKYILNKGRD